MTSGTRRPIFVLGMLPRSGTNHLGDLLGLHPDTELMHPVYEDHLVQWSHHLAHYVDDVSGHWSPDWEVPDDERVELLASIGSGIERWITGDSQRRVVTKMPRVEQAHRFFDLFPSCALLVLVRDGRSLAESIRNTFGWTYERSFHEWSRAARIVLDLSEDRANDDRFAVVRYEDLVTEPRATMRHLCEVTGLEAGCYPFDRIEQLPVRGSSTLSAHGGIHWAPTEKAADFAPLERWAAWSPHLHLRYRSVAGEEHRALGYELDDVGGRSTVGEALKSAWDVVYDYRRRRLRRTLGRVDRAIRRAVKAR